MTQYGFSTLITNYIYAKQMGLHGVLPLSAIRNEWLNDEELQMKVKLDDHEREFEQTPTIETVEGFGDSYSSFISVKDVDGVPTPIHGEGESYKFILTKFYEFARKRKAGMHINMFDSDGDYEFDEFLKDVTSIPSLEFVQEKPMFTSYEDDLREIDIDNAESVYLGISRPMDTQIGKVSQGRIVLISGGTGVNKTWLATMLAFRLGYLEGKKVLFVTYEMSERDIKKRFKAIMGGFNTKLYSVQTEKNKVILKANLKIMNDYLAPLYETENVKVIPNASVRGIKNRLDREVEETGVPFWGVIIDGAEKITPPQGFEGSPQWMRTVENLNLIKSMKLGNLDEANGIPYPVIMTSHLTKNATGDTLAELGDSVRLGQDANLVIRIKKVGDNIRSARILKNREGEEPENEFLYAIDYDQSLLLSPTGIDFQGEGRVAENSQGWSRQFSVVKKRLLSQFFNLDADDLADLKTSQETPDFKTHIKYETEAQEFLYPRNDKVLYGKMSTEDQDKWTKFMNANDNIQVLQKYGEMLAAKYEN